MAIYYTRRLPGNFPREVKITLRSELYEDAIQLWDYFWFGSDRFKLIVQTDHVVPQPGETWKVIPIHSPNGHIVFCRPLRRLRRD